MAKFKKLAMLTMALLASATLAAAVGCDGEESSSSSPAPAPAPGPAPITYETAKGILPNVVSVAANETVYYKYTATVDGSVSTTAYGDVDVIVNGGKSALVNKGDEVVIEVSGKDGKAVENATWYVKEGDGSSYNAPLVLSEACEFDATITWNEDGYYNDFYAVFVPAEYNMYMVMLEQVGDDEIEGLTINSTPAEYVFGVWTTTNPGEEMSLTLSASTPDEIPEGTTPADVTVSLKGYVAPLKTPDIQPTIVEVEDSTAIYAEYYYEIDEYTVFKYTPAKDGVVTFTAPYGGEISAILDLDSALAGNEPEFMLNGEDYLEFPATAGVPVYFMTYECNGPLIVAYEDKAYVAPPAAGTMDDPIALVAGENELTYTQADIDNYNTAKFLTYTATKDVTLTFTYDDEAASVYNFAGPRNTVLVENNGTVAVKAGAEVMIMHQAGMDADDNYVAGDYTFTVAVADGITPDGFNVPFVITSGTAMTLTNDTMNWMYAGATFTAPADGTIAFSNVDATVLTSGTNYGATEYSTTEAMSVKKGSVINVYAPADDTATFTLTFTAGAVTLDGSLFLAYDAVEGANSTTITTEDTNNNVYGKYYVYTATADGTITFMSDDETPAVIQVNGSPTEINGSYNVKAGDVLTITVQTPYGADGYIVDEALTWNLVFTANATGEDLMDMRA